MTKANQEKSDEQLIKNLESKLAKYKEALEFYGNIANWEGQWGCGTGDYSRSRFKPDDFGDEGYSDNFQFLKTIKGKRAREALKE